MIEFYPSTQLVNTLSNTVLFCCLRQHNEWNTKIQAFADTVHTAMGHKGIRLLKNGDLINM